MQTKYASVLSKSQEKTVTHLASQNINPRQVGTKKALTHKKFRAGKPRKIDFERIEVTPRNTGKELSCKEQSFGRKF